MSGAKPLTREELDRWIRWAEGGDGTLELERIVATVQKLERELNEAHAYGYRMESERDVADDARWKAEHGDPS